VDPHGRHHLVREARDDLPVRLPNGLLDDPLIVRRRNHRHAVDDLGKPSFRFKAPYGRFPAAVDDQAGRTPCTPAPKRPRHPLQEEGVGKVVRIEINQVVHRNAR
jgi:hypothetical protein